MTKLEIENGKTVKQWPQPKTEPKICDKDRTGCRNFGFDQPTRKPSTDVQKWLHNRLDENLFGLVLCPPGAGPAQVARAM